MINYTKEQNENAKFALKLNANCDPDKPILMTGECFICFKPYLTEKRPKQDGSEGMFEIAIAIPMDCPVGKSIIAYMGQFKLDKFGKTRGVRVPFKKGNDYIESMKEDASPKEILEIDEKYGNLKDHFFFNAKTKFALNSDDPDKEPQLIDEYGDALDTSKVYGGAVIRAQIAPFSYNVPGNKGVSFGLRAIQVLKKSEFGGDGGQDHSSAFGKKEKPAPEAGSAKNFSAPAEEEEQDVAPAAKKPAPKKKAPVKTKLKKVEPVEPEVEEEDGEPEYDPESVEEDSPDQGPLDDESMFS
jgi:hypothetical protein